MKHLSLIVSICLLSSAVCLRSAAAQDYYDENGDIFDRELKAYAPREPEEKSDAEIIPSFTGPIKRLLDSAGHDSSDSAHWKDFEEVPQEKLNEYYYNSEEMKLHQARRRPVKREDPLGDRLSDIEKDINGLRSTRELDLHKEYEKYQPTKD